MILLRVIVLELFLGGPDDDLKGVETCSPGVVVIK
jgi:hypothetical protein